MFRSAAPGVSVAVVVERVEAAEDDVVEQVAVRAASRAHVEEFEPGDGLAGGHEVFAGVRLPPRVRVRLPPRVRARLLVAGFDAGWRGDDRADGAGLVAEPVDADAGRLLGGLVSGRADHDAHFVEILPVQARVAQPPDEHGAGRGADVLVDARVLLVGGELRVDVARGAAVLEFDEDAAVHLVTGHNEPGFVEAQLDGLNELASTFSQLGVNLTYEFRDTLHDRSITADTGWEILPGRGLDIFQKFVDGDWLNPLLRHQQLRRVKECKVTYQRVSEK